MPYPAGTCRGCGALLDPEHDGSRCKDCREIRNAAEATLRDYRREHGLCLTCGDPAAPVPGARALRRKHCKRHLAYYAARYKRAS